MNIRIIALVIYGLVATTDSFLFANPATNDYSQNNYSNSRVIEPIDDLWLKYKNGTITEKRIVLRRLSSYPNSVISNELENVIISAIASNKSSDYVLFLGLAVSSNSYHILTLSSKDDDSSIANAARLALARRGDSECETYFIRAYKDHPISRSSSIELAKDVSSTEIIWSLTYIGTLNCIVALFDDPPPLANVKNIRVIPLSSKLTFFKNAGLEIPSNEQQSEQQLNRWWKNNREIIIRQLSAVDKLPRLDFSGISILFY